MTAPGGVPNLPMGALTVDTLADKLQNMSAASMRGRVSERIPSIFNSSMGGNAASEFSFFGIITTLWAGFNEAVANADPADIQGPEDLPGLMINFVEGLPLIGDFVALIESIINGTYEVGDVLAMIKNAFDSLGEMLGFSGNFDLDDLVAKFVEVLASFPVIGGWVEAMLGTYAGDDAVLLAVQNIFAPIRALMELVAGFELGSGFPELSDVIAGWGEVLRGDSPLPAFNLFGTPRPSLFSQLSLSSIGDFSPNLLDQPLFGWEGAVDDPAGEWVVDTNRFHVQGNSVRALVDGAAHELLSDPALPVTPGQRVEMTIHASWVDLVSSGAPVELGVVGFDAADAEVLNTVIASAGTGLPAWSADHPDADAEGWVPLSATFIVPQSPAVSSIRMSLQVAEGATAGAVWFSDATARKTQRLPESFVGGLVEKLTGFSPDGFFDSSRLAGLIEQSRIAGLVERLVGIDIDGNLDASFLTGLIEQSQIAGLVNRLSGLSVDGFLDSSRLAGALSQGQLDIPNVQDIVDRIVEGGGGSGIGNAVDTIRDRIGGIFETANRADANVIDIQASVQQLVDDTSAGVTGNSNSVVFTGADGATLTGFTVGPNFDSIVIRNPGDGTAVTAGIKAGLGNGHYWAVFDTTQYAIDDQSVSGVFGKQGSTAAATTLTNRTDPLMTNGAYTNVTKDQVTIGYWTRSGSTFTFHQLATVSRTTNIGARVELRAIGDNYFTLINGVQALAVTDVGGNVTIGPTNRSCGFVEERDTILFTTVDSFWLASFAMADYAPAGGVTTVASWHLTRSSTSSANLSVSNGAVAVLPASFLTLQDSATDVTVTDLGRGIVTIGTAGWYEIDAAIMAKPSDGDIDFWFAPCWALYRNGAQVTGPLGMGVSKKMFLSAGDTVQMAVVGVAALPTSAQTTTATTNSPVGAQININTIKGYASFSGKLVA